MKISENKCRVCHDPITTEKPATMVLVRGINGKYGAKVHNGLCQQSDRVVHLIGGIPAKVDHVGYIRR